VRDGRSSFVPIGKLAGSAGPLSVIALIVQGGTLMTLPAILPRVAGDFGPLGLAATVLLVAMSAGNMLVGWLIGRMDARAVIAGGIAATAAGWLGAAFAQDRMLLIATLAMAGAGVAASTIVPGIAVITRDAANRRGMALALFLGATIVGGAIMPPAMSLIAEAWHWRGAMMLASGAMVAAMPLLLFVPRGVAAAKADVPQAAARAASPAFGATRVTIAMTMVQLSINGILFASVDGLMRQGLDHGDAVAAFGLANLMGLPALIAGGWAADRIGGRAAFAAACLMLAGGSAALLAAAPFGMVGVVAFVLLWGMASALPGQTGAMMIEEVAPGERFPALLGTAVAVASLVGALAPMLSDLMLAAGGSLAGIALVYAFLALGGAMLVTGRRNPFTK